MPTGRSTEASWSESSERCRLSDNGYSLRVRYDNDSHMFRECIYQSA